MELYVFSTSDAVIGLSTYHEIIRSEQNFDIIWTLAVRYLLYAMSSWTTSFSLSVCWNSVGIHGIIWIYPDQSHLWWHPWIDQSLCQILGVWKEKYERRGICFQQGPGFVSYQKSHSLTWDRELRSYGETQQLLYRPAISSAQKCPVHGIQMTWFEWFEKRGEIIFGCIKLIIN